MRVTAASSSSSSCSSGATVLVPSDIPTHCASLSRRVLPSRHGLSHGLRVSNIRLGMARRMHGIVSRCCSRQRLARRYGRPLFLCLWRPDTVLVEHPCSELAGTSWPRGLLQSEHPASLRAHRAFHGDGVWFVCSEGPVRRGCRNGCEWLRSVTSLQNKFLVPPAQV